MINKVQNLILPFYFGSIREEERLMVERELLIDTEALVSYLDLKRKLEMAVEIPPDPSANLWIRLRTQLKPKKKIIFSVSLGAAIAASFLIYAFLAFRPSPSIQRPSDAIEVLFDTRRELPASSNVL